MDCVKCKGELQKVSIGDVEVDRCAECSGIWFDFGELKQVLEQDDIEKLKNVLENNKDDDTERGTCPRCGGEGKMVQCTSLRDNDIHIDICSVCYGQWLDGGELERLKNEGIFQNVAGFFKGLL